MQFDVSVQGTFYKTVTAPNTGSALSAVSIDIANGLVPNLNPDLPHSISIIPQPADPFEKWASVAPQNPARFTVWQAPDEIEWIYDQPRSPTGQYLADDPNTPESESAMRWRLHTNVS